MESVGGYAYFVSEGTLSADLKFLFFFFLKTFFGSPDNHWGYA